MKQRNITCNVTLVLYPEVIFHYLSDSYGFQTVVSVKPVCFQMDSQIQLADHKLFIEMIYCNINVQLYFQDKKPQNDHNRTNKIMLS